MAIDIRADVRCSLGTVISASISDDYVQGNGLIKSTGNVLINGVITPAPGTKVTFTYTKSGITRTIPRAMRVLSSFADPFRRTTTVELGCKLTYLSDLSDPINWTAFDDPENSELTEEDALIVTIPINASSAMNKCLQELGINASQNPLTNKFSIAEFDFSAGYVSVLSDLLVSESYCGYLDINETLQVFFLDEPGGSGPVIASSSLIDLGPIGAGQLPGEAVTVSYDTLKLKQPDPDADSEEIKRINWEYDSTVSSPEYYYINYRDSSNVLQTRVFGSLSSTSVATDYTTIRVIDEDGRTENKEVVTSRYTVEEVNAIAKLANCAAKFLENGFDFDNSSITTTTSENYVYDTKGNQVLATIRKREPAAVALGSANFDWVYDGQKYSASYQNITTEFTRIESEQSGNYTKTKTSTYKLFAFTQAGQQSIAVARETFPDSAELAEIIASSIFNSGLVHDNTTIQTRLTGATAEERPPAAERTNAAYAKDGDPNNGWRTESRNSLELAVGSTTAQRRIELSMPYAPDDVFSGPTGGPFTSISSDAPAKANRFGRTQNRLLLGNRSGMSIQIAPEKLPNAPFSPVYIEAAGTIALYRVNAASWTMDANGIVASTDALFWGTAGRTA